MRAEDEALCVFVRARDILLRTLAAPGPFQGMQPDADAVRVDGEKLEAAPDLSFGAFRLDDEPFGTPAAILKPRGQGAEKGGRETPRNGGVVGVERAQERPMRVRSELELRRAEAQRLGEKRAPQTADGVVG